MNTHLGQRKRIDEPTCYDGFVLAQLSVPLAQQFLTNETVQLELDGFFVQFHTCDRTG